MKKILLVLLFPTIAVTHFACIGYDIPPHLLKEKPYTLLKGSEQIGRDQLMNRFLVVKGILLLKDAESNQILSILGQPQDIETYKQEGAEDWLYVYYKSYTGKTKGEPGKFMVRFYQGKVIDVVKDLDNFSF